VRSAARRPRRRVRSLSGRRSVCRRALERGKDPRLVRRLGSIPFRRLRPVWRLSGTWLCGPANSPGGAHLVRRLGALHRSRARLIAERTSSLNACHFPGKNSGKRKLPGRVKPFGEGCAIAQREHEAKGRSDHTPLCLDGHRWNQSATCQEDVELPHPCMASVAPWHREGSCPAGGSGNRGTCVSCFEPATS